MAIYQEASPAPPVTARRGTSQPTGKRRRQSPVTPGRQAQGRAKPSPASSCLVTQGAKPRGRKWAGVYPPGTSDRGDHGEQRRGEGSGRGFTPRTLPTEPTQIKSHLPTQIKSHLAAGIEPYRRIDRGNHKGGRATKGGPQRRSSGAGGADARAGDRGSRGARRRRGPTPTHQKTDQPPNGGHAEAVPPARSQSEQEQATSAPLRRNGGPGGRAANQRPAGRNPDHVPGRAGTNAAKGRNPEPRPRSIFAQMLGFAQQIDRFTRRRGREHPSGFSSRRGSTTTIFEQNPRHICAKMRRGQGRRARPKRHLPRVGRTIAAQYDPFLVGGTSASRGGSLRGASRRGNIIGGIASYASG